jgi:hypothetical protein
LVTLPELVIGSALLRIGEHGISLVNLFHPGLRARFLRHVRMVLSRELAVGLLDFVRIGVARYSKYLVVVLIVHWRMIKVDSLM